MNEIKVVGKKQIEEKRDAVAETERAEIKELKERLDTIRQAMRETMTEGEDYGIIPGVAKPSLLQPGAEKLAFLFRLAPRYKTQVQLSGDHMTVFSECRLFHIPTGQFVGMGNGVCSTKEKKYAFRHAAKKCPLCGKETIIKGKEEYGGGWVCYAKKGGCGAKWRDGDPKIEDQESGFVENENIADQYNTVMKMANKRAFIAAVKTATAASELFTQDVEDLEFVQEAHVEKPKPKEKPERKEEKKTDEAFGEAQEADDIEFCKSLPKDVQACLKLKFKNFEKIRQYIREKNYDSEAIENEIAEEFGLKQGVKK